MEQKTEASQAVEKQVLPHLPRAVGYRHTMDNTEGIKGNKPVVVFCATKPNPFGIPGLDYSASFPVTTETLFTADQMRAYARAALKAQPAPTEAPDFCPECHLQEGQPDRLEMKIVGRRMADWLFGLAAAQDMPHKSWSETCSQLACLWSAVENGAVAQAPTEAAQGEDSARLDWMESNVAEIYRLYNWEEYQIKKDWKHIAYGKTVREAIDRARASAEAGGVKP